MFDKRLKTLLSEKGMTVTSLAKATGISRTTIQSWTVGAKPSIYELDKVATVFKMTIDELVFSRKPQVSVADIFQETEIHTGNYRIKITKLTNKEGDD